MDNSKTIEQRLSNIESLLTGTKTVLTFDEVATYTGLSKSYLYKLTSGNQIPHYKPNGKNVYFNKAEIDSWLLRNEVKTNDVIEKEATNFVTLNNKG